MPPVFPVPPPQSELSLSPLSWGGLPGCRRVVLDELSAPSVPSVPSVPFRPSRPVRPSHPVPFRPAWPGLARPVSSRPVPFGLVSVSLFLLSSLLSSLSPLSLSSLLSYPLSSL